MGTQIDKALRNAKAEVKAGQAAAARRTLLQALDAFSDNARLLAALAEVQTACTGLPARPFGRPQIARFLQTHATADRAMVIDELAAAVRLNPQSPPAQGFLGATLLQARLYPAAIRHLRLALTLDPGFFEAGVNLANALLAAGDPLQALATIDGVLAQRPDAPPALLLKARLLAQTHREAEAIVVFDRYRALMPADLAAAIDHAAALNAASRLDEAEGILRMVLEKAPSAQAHGGLGNVLLNKGAVAQSAAQFEAALRLAPRSAISFFNLGRARDFTADDPLIPAMADLAEQGGLAPEDMAALHFGLAKAYEDIGDVDRSFAHLQRGNALRATLINYHIDQDRQLLASFAARFSAQACPALRPTQPPAKRPIFVLGMMRSGTTLLEQILSSHPQVHGAGELETLPRLLAEAGPAPLSPEVLVRIRDGYLATLLAQETEKPVIVDKLPANFRLIGLIRKALPEAHILHMQRNPIAVCWSIYKTYFTNVGIGYAHSLQDTITYYDLYEDLMAKWRADYPGEFLDVDYEALTRDPEPAIRRVLAFCGLPFDPACLAPQGNRRAVRTASVRQVRDGIYQGSSGKWKAFEAHLAPLIDHFRAKA